MRQLARDPDGLPRDRPRTDRLSPPWTRTRVIVLLGALTSVVLIVLSAQAIGLDPQRFVDGWYDLGNLLERMTPIKLPALTAVAKPVVDTLMIAIAGTAIATVISLPLAFLAASNTTPLPAVRMIARSIILGARSVPDLVYALIFVRVLGVGVLPGVLAIAVYSTGMIGKLFADAIEEADPRVHQAVVSVGASRSQAVVSAVLPQVTPSFVATVLYRLDMNVAASAVLGFVGAGGIGFELYNTLRTLQYQRGLGIALIVIALVVAVERTSAAIRARIVGHTSTRLPSLWKPAAKPARAPGLSPPWTRSRVVRFWVIGVAAALTVASFAGLGISPGILLRAVPDLLAGIGSFLPPDFGSLVGQLPDALGDTLAIAVAATSLATVLSLPFAFFAARTISPHPVVYHVARLIIVLARGLPPLVLALVFISAFGLGPFAGVIALALSSLGLTAKLMADAVEHVDAGPGSALRAVGATRVQQATAAVLPQVAPSFVATVLFTLDNTIRSSTIVGIVGAGGVGFLIYQSVQTLEFRTTSAVLIVVFVTVFVVERVSDAVRRRIL